MVLTGSMKGASMVIFGKDLHWSLCEDRRGNEDEMDRKFERFVV